MSRGVRFAGPGDAPAIAAAQAASWDHTYRGLMPDHVIDRVTVETRTPYWERALAGGAAVLVATDGGAVVGFCSLAPPVGGTAEITAMYVAPAALGHGHGRRMMERALAWFGERGASSAVLWVLDSNRRGREFYERAGWGADGVEKVDEVFGAPLHHVRYAIDL